MLRLLPKGRQLLLFNKFDSELTSPDDRGRRLRSDKQARSQFGSMRTEVGQLQRVGRVRVTFTLFRAILAWGGHGWLHTRSGYWQKFIWCFTLLRNGRDRVPHCSWRSHQLACVVSSVRSHTRGIQDLTPMYVWGFSPGCVFALLDWHFLLAISKQSR